MSGNAHALAQQIQADISHRLNISNQSHEVQHVAMAAIAASIERASKFYIKQLSDALQDDVNDGR